MWRISKLFSSICTRDLNPLYHKALGNVTKIYKNIYCEIGCERVDDTINTYLQEKERGSEDPPEDPIFKSTDRRSDESNWCVLSGSEIEREVVSVTLVHHLHSESSPVEHVGPGVNYTILAIND